MKTNLARLTFMLGWLVALSPLAYAQPIEAAVYSCLGSFLITRTGGITTNLSIPYDFGGTADNGVDYVTLPDFVTHVADSSNTTIIIDPIADGVAEPIETVGLRLQPPSPDVFPPPYLLSAAANRQTLARLTIRDAALYPTHPHLTGKRAALLRRRGLLRGSVVNQVIVPLPTIVSNDPTVPPPVGAVAITWAVEASPDMVAWQEIGTTSDPEEFVDVDAGDAPQRFYRFRQVTPGAP